MKFLIRSGEKVYDVEVLDLKSRPILAIVEGEQFEIWPEENPAETAAPMEKPVEKPVPHSALHTPPPTGVIPSGTGLNVKTMRAPIPGVILEVMVSAGERVAYGQALFVIEAMKMRNTIRAPRIGEVAEVCVSVGQTVNHNDTLLMFME